MVRSLRQLHFKIWLLLAMVLPIGFIAALFVRPNWIYSPAPKSSQQFSAQLVLLPDSSSRLTVSLAQPLNMPCVVMRKEKNRETTLGMIQSGGDHIYTLEHSLPEENIRLYDVIHQKEITSFVVVAIK